MAIWLKRLINVLLEPTWCQLCGSRLLEQPIGFREQGSRYLCPVARCGASNKPTLALG